MSLKFHILLQIILIASVCLLATGGYVLFQVNREVSLQTANTLDAASRYLDVQLAGLQAPDLQSNRFPDFALWKQVNTASGICLRFAPLDERTSTRSICQGEKLPVRHWPLWFAGFYQRMFKTGIELSHPVSFKGLKYGMLTITPSADTELATAWHRSKNLWGVATINTLAVCVWVYFAIRRAFQPAQLIVKWLGQTEQEFTSALPTFKLQEWQRIGLAINHYANTQKQLLAERKHLVLKLLSVQEDERTALARELHDELGQCLTGINALSASILQTAQEHCPPLVAEVESIAVINRRIMVTVKHLLAYLHPAELEALGLEACLQAMVTEWNHQHAGRMRCQMTISGAGQSLMPPLQIIVYRCIQEGLTNISKHANATDARIRLDISPNNLKLTIEDNGQLSAFPLPKNKGMGLLGMRERVTGLGGTLHLGKSPLGGFLLEIGLPKMINNGKNT